MWAVTAKDVGNKCAGNPPKDKRIKLKAGFEKNKTKKPTPSFIGMHASTYPSVWQSACVFNGESESR